MDENSVVGMVAWREKKSVDWKAR
jgi:hypothetical protein